MACYLSRFMTVIFLLSVLVSFPHCAFCSWPDFRGPLHNGHVPANPDGSPLGLPVQWSESENVVWKTEIPLKGLSSPVIWGDRIWLTTAAEDGLEMFVLCLDCETGAIVINRRLFTNEAPEPLRNEVNSYASPSPVIEEGRVYVHFGSYGTACLDSQTGGTLWERRDYPCLHVCGPGSSPFLYQDKLILTFDGMNLQYVVALDKVTGQEIWKVDRATAWTDLDEKGQVKWEGSLRKAFCTPIAATIDGRDQLIVPASMTAFAYDPKDGSEIWHIRDGGVSAACRPVVGNGMVFFSIGQAPDGYIGVRLGDMQGDITDTHLVWAQGKAVSKRSSPILLDDLLYMANEGGVVCCLDAKTGEIVWKERLGGGVSSSPIYADGHLYFFDEKGTATLLKPGRTYQILQTNHLDEGMMASPAVDGKALFLRTKTHLYRIEAGS